MSENMSTDETKKREAEKKKVQENMEKKEKS